MPNPTPNAAMPRRLCAAAANLGGASSMLRLARGGEPRLPSGPALSGWAARAAAMLDMGPFMVGVPLAAPALTPAPARVAVTRSEVRP
jgi:hypothetical protein